MVRSRDSRVCSLTEHAHSHAMQQSLHCPDQHHLANLHTRERERAQPTQLDGTSCARCISPSSDHHICTALLPACHALPQKQAPSNWPPACKWSLGTSHCLCLGHHACTHRAAACVATHARIQAGMLLLTDYPIAPPQGTFTRVRLMRVSLSGRSTPWRTAQEWSMASPPPFSTWGTPRLALVRRVNDVATCGSTRHPHPYSRVCACAPHAQIPAPSRHSPAGPLLAHLFTPRSNPPSLSHTDALTFTHCADDCWQDCLSSDSLNGSYHNAAGAPIVDVSRFPKGLRALSDYGAAKGVGLGWCVPNEFSCARFFAWWRWRRWWSI
jgi:hypothetical protein